VLKEDTVYAWIVRRLVARRFRELSRGDASRIVRKLDDDSVFTMLGDHALGGERRGAAAVAALFDEMFRRLPGIVIRPVHVVVGGWPWRTTIATQFVVTADLPNGHPYRNEGMQLLRLRWGRIREERLYEDTAVLHDALTAAHTAP
jgi:ketosteroid isomerase-like protein